MQCSSVSGKLQNVNKQGKSLSEQHLKENNGSGPRRLYDHSSKHSEPLVEFNPTITHYSRLRTWLQTTEGLQDFRLLYRTA